MLIRFFCSCVLLLFSLVVFGAACPQPAYCDRDCWDPEGDYRPVKPASKTVPTHIIVHHTADKTIFTPQTDYAQIVQAYYDYHVNTKGWDDIGYNWLIDPNGIIYEGRGNANRGAHFSCMNSQTMGVAMIGNFEAKLPTALALKALERLIAWEANDKNIDVETTGFHQEAQKDLFHVSGHRDANGAIKSCTTTACPGTSLYQYLEELRLNVASMPCYSDLPNSLNCADALVLACGEVQQGQIKAQAGQAYRYKCSNTFFKGQEKIYQVTATKNGVLEARITGYSGNVQVFIFDDCSPLNCVGTSSNGLASYNNAKNGQVYYIVVDAEKEESSNFNIVARCIEDTTRQDVFLSNLVLTSTTLQAGESIEVFVDHHYLGYQTTQALPELQLDYYLSTVCDPDASLIYLGSEQVKVGKDQKQTTVSKIVKIPNDVKAGQYHLLLKTDNTKQIQEADEANNTICASVAIDAVVSTQNLFQEQIRVYPNPVREVLNIANSGSLPINQAQVLDGKGRVVTSVNGLAVHSIDLQNLPQGMYWVKVRNVLFQEAIFKVQKL